MVGVVTDTCVIISPTLSLAEDNPHFDPKKKVWPARLQNKYGSKAAATSACST